MIETRGVVAALEGEFALIDTERAVGCEHCQGKGCGTGMLSQLACSGKNRIKALNNLDARPGERVIVGIADGALLKGATVAYLLPLSLVVIGAVAGNHFAATDGAAAFGALAGLIAGITLAWGYNRRQRANVQFQPTVLQRL